MNSTSPARFTLRPFPPRQAANRTCHRRRPGAGLLWSGLALAAAPWLTAQPDCRSVLGAHLKPYTPESRVSWAGEFVTIPTYMEDRYANNSMLFGAIDVTTRSKRHQFYFEGGAKRSTVDSSGHSDTDRALEASVTTETHVETGVPIGTGKGKPTTTVTTPTGDAAGVAATTTTVATTGTENDPRYGWREFFYQYRGDTTRIRAGLGTTRLGDYFLVNERLLGLSLQQQFGRATLSATAGSVGDFARMTDFCGTKRLTNLVEKEKYETVGHDFGDTNLAGVVFAWDRTGIAPAGGSAPRIGADEFALTEDLAPRRAGAGWGPSQVGLLGYHESDRVADENRTWLGAFARFDLAPGLSLKVQALYQDGHDDALLGYGRIDRDYFWSNASNTTFHLGYFGKYNLGRPATFEASFSNLFLGEIMRMDAVDIPVVFAGVRHHFPGRRKVSVQLQGVEQLQAENMKEVDLEVGANVLPHLRVVAIGAYIYSRATKVPENYVAKMEVRLGF